MVRTPTISATSCYQAPRPGFDPYGVVLASSLGDPAESGEKFVFIDPSVEWKEVIANFYSHSANWEPIEQKLDYWTRALAATHADIAFTEEHLLFDRSSAVVQRQLEKAAAQQSLVEQLSDLRFTVVTEGALETIYLAECKTYQYADAFTLHHEFGHFPLEGDGMANWEAKKKEIRIRRDQLMWGRVLRRYFRSVLRDIRRHFRTIVRTLFMHMNDQSNDDELLVLATARQPVIPSTINWILHGQTRPFSPD